LTLYFFVLANDLYTGEETFKGSGMTLRAVLLEAPFKLWLLGSLLGFLVAMSLWLVDRVVRASGWAFKKLPIPHWSELPSPSRRRFLGEAAMALSAAPFVAGVYGLFYGRLNLETTRHRVKLRRLPKAFEGFRIVQLSDLHISAFMSAEEIRRYVAIANRLKADLVALTGDFVTWEAAMEGTVVQALSDLKAPFGVFGCLGNHENLTQTQDSITRLFAAEGIHILRQARTPVQVGNESINLIGVDFQSLFGGRYDPQWPSSAYMHGVERLVIPDTVNILLSHNPNTFDRAAEMGIDLSLAGHTHGGQVTLEFIHPDLSPARLLTPYVRGWFQKGDAQLYVNRGIGTLGVPARFGSSPEITVLELTRMD
jgi:predicted MPP superfamily phosphohydrolase